MRILVEFRDQALADWANRLEQLSGGSGRLALAQALNQGGDVVREQTVAAETKQTNLRQGTIDAAQATISADPASLSYTIFSKGGNVRLKYFGAVEGGGGVTSWEWGSAHFHSGAFITSGRQGARYAVGKLNRHVFERLDPTDRGWNRKTGKKPHLSKIRWARSGLYIPTEMVRGATAAAFERGSSTVLSTTVIQRLGSLLP